MVREIIGLLFLTTLLVSGCSSEEIEEGEVVVREYFSLDINLGFTPKINPRFNPSLTNPSPGVRGFYEGTLVNISAKNSEDYVFSYWKINPGRSEDFLVYDKNYSFNITDDVVINAYFGCANDFSCVEEYACENNTCVYVGGLKIFELIIAISEVEIEKDVLLAENLYDRLKEERYADIKIEYFENINASDFDDKGLIAILDRKTIIVRGENLLEIHDDFFLSVDNALRRERIPINRIEKLMSYEVTNHNVYKLFYNK